MSPLEIVRQAVDRTFETSDGENSPIELLPGMSTAQIDEFASSLPCALPVSIRQLLEYCRGFQGTAADVVDFTGRDMAFEYPSAFPHGIPIASDGFGNFWVVDLHADSSIWAPIYFACHDAPVILFQSNSLEEFLSELFALYTPPFKSAVDDVHEDRLFRVWRSNPGVLSHQACIASSDPDLRHFAESLGPDFQVIDLRAQVIGSGFSWGRYGPNTEVRRFGSAPIFAYRKPQGFFRKLFGKSA